ncbi:MAG: hypothetical protein U0V48_08875 [Anaerolineales bacterium]
MHFLPHLQLGDLIRGELIEFAASNDPSDFAPMLTRIWLGLTLAMVPLRISPA